MARLRWRWRRLPTAKAKTEILNDVLSSYINIDIRVLADFQKIAELQQLLRVLASRLWPEACRIGDRARGAAAQVGEPRRGGPGGCRPLAGGGLRGGRCTARCARVR